MSDSKPRSSYIPPSRRSLSTSATTVRRGRAVSTTSTRGHSHGTRDAALEIRRHVASVAQHSRSVAENFAEQLKKYKTFAPLLASGGVYSEVSFPSWTQGAATSIDSILDARTSFLVRHTTHHRIVAPKDTSHSTRNRVVTLPEGLDGTTINNAASPLFDEHASVSAAAADDPVFQLWLQNHPKATVKEKLQELGRRRKEVVEKERESRSKYLRKWHAELDMLMDDKTMTSGAAADQQQPQLSTPILTPKPPTTTHRKGGVTDEQYEAQRATWEMFHFALSHSGGGVPSTEAADTQTSTAAPDTILTGDDTELQELKDWVEGGWHDHTHRHEEAALIIQCVFRRFRAKSEVQRRRYSRAQLVQERLKAEEEAMYAWRVAVQVMSDTSLGREKTTDDDVESTLRGMNFFIKSINAKVTRRRAQHLRDRELDFETQTFAAVRIQALYRGHRGRVFVKELRCPEIGAQRRHRLEMAAVCKIQKIWRGFRTRQFLQKKQKCALQIQMVFRQFVAIRTLNHLRREARKEDQHALRTFAANRIKKFLGECVLRRRILYKKAMPKLLLLYRVGRGFVDRRELCNRSYGRRLKALVLIQSIARMWRAKAARRQRKMSVEAIYLNDTQDEAALAVQRVYRGSVGRKEAKVAKQNKLLAEIQGKENDAAITIQSAYRSHRGRETLKATSAARSSKSSTNHYNNNKNDYEDDYEDDQSKLEEDNTKNDAAFMLQQFYLNHIRRTNLNKYLKACAKVIIQFFRRVPSYKLVAQRKHKIAHVVEDEAAVSIQTALRAHQAKTFTEQLKQKREQEHWSLRADEAAIVIMKFLRYARTKKRILRKRM